MRLFLLPILLTAISFTAFAQPSDYIVLKKKNNRTLKTYFPGTFISASTYTGFTLNGFIKEIRNDSVVVEQQEVRQFATQFGVPALDTIVYTIKLHYKDIHSYHYAAARLAASRGRKGGLLQNILMIGGTGFIIIELVNTAYRKESLSDDNKLTALGIAAAVAATGFLWRYLQIKQNKPGKKYRVIYVNMGTKGF